MHQEFQSSYDYYPQFIFRSPLIPFRRNKMNVEELLQYTKQLFFKEAIYLASPVLLDELTKWHNGELKEQKEIDRLVISIYKYFSRMQSRCTPYGLFAGCATGEWGDKNEIILKDTTKRHTRLDMNFLCALAQQLSVDSAISPRLLFYPNNSIYAFGDQLRYVEYKYVNNRRRHQISSADYSDYLRLILNKAKHGAVINDLAMLLVDSEITLVEAENFIKELISNQILVSELEPAVTGEEFIYQIINTLERINGKSPSAEIDQIIQVLISAQQKIELLDKQISNETEGYRDISSKLSGLKVPIEENQLFQTDLYKTTAHAMLSGSIQEQLLEAMGFLNAITLEEGNPNLKKFKENFYSRYENTEVPLLEVLDTETGIGYIGTDTVGSNILLNDIFLPGSTSNSYDIKWNKWQEVLHARLITAFKNGDFKVTFTNDDIRGESTASILPDSFTIMFRMVENNKIFFQTSGGSSGANLLGRFAYGDAAIHGIIKDITAHEQSVNNGKILAEIVHLPESRIGNILLRPTFHKYEIPYLGKSSLPIENQILLQDLMLSVQNDKVVLRSKKLNKEIIPRLTTAHNFSSNALPIYHFLCDLQTQYFTKSGVGFHWGALSKNYKFLPRAEYKNVILSRAKWQLLKTDFQILFNEKDSNYERQVIEWRGKWNIPQYALLADGDNELLIDFDDHLSVKMFISSIKKKENIILEEFLFNADDLVIKDGDANGYTNEFIAVLLKKNQNIPPGPSFAIVNRTGNQVQREYSIGSEWLYYKLYCGVKTADKLLSKVIKPLTEEVIQNKLADKFFFIRYSDPEPHIRLRFHTQNLSSIGEIISMASQYIQPSINQGFIYKLQTDTYRQELRRYGENSIDIAEEFFYIDSICALSLIDALDNGSGEHIRWQFALRSIDDLLLAFQYTASEKLSLIEQLKNNFIQEHNGDKELKFGLDAKFRAIRKSVEGVLNRDNDSGSDIFPHIDQLNWKQTQLQSLVDKLKDLKTRNQLQVSENDLASSFMHMIINRIFTSRQRTCEMVLYDLLYRYHKSMNARGKTGNPLLNKVAKISD